MTNLVPAMDFLTERNGPSPAGTFGLVVALLLIVLLMASELRLPWSEKRPPGPVASREPEEVREGRDLYWAVVWVLLLTLVIIVVERFVVLA